MNISFFSKGALVLLTFFVYAAATISPAYATPVPTLVKDINTGNVGTGIDEMKVFGDAVYFDAYDDTLGYGLWVTDGTSDTPGDRTHTRLVKAFSGGGASIQDLTVVGDTLFFSVNDGTHGVELWKTDGTEEGTMILKDINPIGDSYPDGFADISSGPTKTLLFYADDGINGKELWVTDGIIDAEGESVHTHLVKDIHFGESGAGFDRSQVIGTTLWFTANDGVVGTELWKSDGTNEGTVLVKDILDGAAGAAPAFIEDMGDGNVAFVADDGTHGYELWKSDGTSVGTSMITDLVSDGQVIVFDGIGDPVNHLAYFSLGGVASGTELWVTDGTEIGTTLVKDINVTGNASPGNFFTITPGVLAFSADDGVHGQELWFTDGTEIGTHIVSDINLTGDAYPDNFIYHPGTGILYFTADDGTGDELWKTNGTIDDPLNAHDNTSKVKDINPNGQGVDFFINVGPLLILSANDDAHGNTVWISDGTSLGTSMITRVNQGTTTADSYAHFVDAGPNMVGSAYSAEYGDELWVSDGTESGTVLLKDINPSGSSNPSDFYALPGAVIFHATDADHGDELWISDGTEIGTVMLKDINPTGSSSVSNIIYWDGRLYFTANNGVDGAELWQSNGTSEGTVLLKDVRDGALGADIGDFTIIASSLVFTANDGVHGKELWKTDGTTEGTVMVQDIYPGSEGSNPFDLLEYNGGVLFDANDGTHQMELWKSDGTSEGTVLVKDVCTGCAGQPSYMTKYNDLVYMTMYEIDGGTGVEVWKTDGTDAGTSIVKDINAGYEYASPKNFTVAGGILFFTADSGSGVHQLWKTDGSEIGTALVKEITSYDDDYNNFKAIGDLLYFTVTDSSHGEEPWVSDGTTAGTHILADVYPGGQGSNTRDFVQGGSDLYFTAGSQQYGVELWTLPIPVAVDSTAPTFSSVTATPAETTADISWTTNEASSTMVLYGTTDSYGTSSALTDTGTRVTSHSVALTGLTACTQYHFAVRSTDVSDNEGISTDGLFTTTGCPVDDGGGSGDGGAGDGGGDSGSADHGIIQSAVQSAANVHVTYADASTVDITPFGGSSNFRFTLSSNKMRLIVTNGREIRVFMNGVRVQKVKVGTAALKKNQYAFTVSKLYNGFDSVVLVTGAKKKSGKITSYKLGVSNVLNKKSSSAVKIKSNTKITVKKVKGKKQIKISFGSLKNTSVYTWTIASKGTGKIKK